MGIWRASILRLHAWGGKGERQSVILLAIIMRQIRRFHGTILKVWWCLKNSVHLPIYLFSLYFLLTYKSPFAGKWNCDPSWMVNFSFPWANQSDIFHKIQWINLIKEDVCIVWMHVWEMHALLSFSVWFALLSTCLVLEISESVVYIVCEPQEHLLKVGIRMDSVQVRRPENEKSVERDMLLVDDTAEPWS